MLQVVRVHTEGEGKKKKKDLYLCIFFVIPVENFQSFHSLSGLISALSMLTSNYRDLQNAARTAAKNTHYLPFTEEVHTCMGAHQTHHCFFVRECIMALCTCEKDG